MCIAKIGELQNDVRIFQLGSSIVKPMAWLNAKQVLIPYLNNNSKIKNSIRKPFITAISNDQLL